MRLISPRGVALTAALAAAALGGYSLHHPLSRASAVGDTAPAAAATASPAPPVALPDFSAIVHRYGPAVVNVSVVGAHPNLAEQSPFGQLDPSDPFFQFFRRFGNPVPRGETITRGIGSGFIIRSDGVILTNAHVVDHATDVRVKLTDKREFRAKVIGLDKATDVAVLRIDATGLPTVAPGTVSPQVGEWVLAIGSPFGFENSATAGIVSGRARSLPDEGYVPFLQTDVPVNPGNSGGPLFNLAGQVVGINSQIYTHSGGYMGLSFAIPIEVAMKVEQQLLAHGKVERGSIGVTIQPVNQALADSFGLPKPEGALVSAVEPSSPAARAGLQPGDVILSLNGKAVEDSNDLPPRVADLGPGARAHLGVWRARTQRELEVTTAEAPDSGAVADASGGAAQGRLGLVVRPLTPEEQRQDKVKGGVLVEDVSGPAAQAGIQPGDVVLSFDGAPVSSVEQLHGMVAKAQHHLALLVQRGDTRLFIPVDLG